LPVSFVAFDILYLDSGQITERKLMERKDALTSTVSEDKTLAVSRYIETTGIDFYNLAASQGLEGVVAKRKDSLYFIGRRSKDWVKFKRKQEADLVIAGLAPGEDKGIRSLVLGVYREGVLVHQGSVAFGLSGDVQKTILQFAKGHRRPCPLSPPVADDSIVWMEPKLVCAVEYMMRTAGGYMRQPAFKGLALDKAPEDCVADW
jgi:bifunctional non-homologous end joining protein LigD/DNA ligase-1